MSNLYKAEDRVVDMVRVLIGKYHPDLALCVDEIAVLFREKAAKKGGIALLGKSQKAPPLIGVLGDTDYKFILELAQDEWLNLDTSKQNALLDHLLCGCRAEETDSGEIKYSIAPPDVSFYWDELNRHGDWRPRPETENDDVDLVATFSKSTATSSADLDDLLTED